MKLSRPNHFPPPTDPYEARLIFLFLVSVYKVPLFISVSVYIGCPLRVQEI